MAALVFRVTHIDEQGHRRRLTVMGRSSGLVIHWVESMLGEARAMSVVCLRNTRRSDATGLQLGRRPMGGAPEGDVVRVRRSKR